MRRKHKDCQRSDGNCTLCSLVSYGRDCHNRIITKLEWARQMDGLTQQQLADAAGVNIRLVQKVEGGEAQAGNLTAKNLIALADALGMDPRDLI